MTHQLILHQRVVAFCRCRFVGCVLLTRSCTRRTAVCGDRRDRKNILGEKTPHYFAASSTAGKKMSLLHFIAVYKQPRVFHRISWKRMMSLFSRTFHDNKIMTFFVYREHRMQSRHPDPRSLGRKRPMSIKSLNGTRTAHCSGAKIPI